MIVVHKSGILRFEVKIGTDEISTVIHEIQRRKVALAACTQVSIQIAIQGKYRRSEVLPREETARGNDLKSVQWLFGIEDYSIVIEEVSVEKVFSIQAIFELNCGMIGICDVEEVKQKLDALFEELESNGFEIQ